jgi:hypothetical protein
MQFSLRTVLLLVTVSCVGLSLWIVPAERQRRAVAAIEALDGAVAYVEPGEATEASSVRFFKWSLPADYFYDVLQVDFSGTQVTDVGLAHLQRLTHLRWLSLNYTHVTDAGLGHLRSLTGLRWLDLSGTQITDAGLANLQSLTGLQSLRLNGTIVTDAGLAHLRTMTSLSTLLLNGTHVTDDGVAQLEQALPKCRIYYGP